MAMRKDEHAWADAVEAVEEPATAGSCRLKVIAVHPWIKHLGNVSMRRRELDTSRQRKLFDLLRLGSSINSRGLICRALAHLTAKLQRRPRTELGLLVAGYPLVKFDKPSNFLETPTSWSPALRQNGCLLAGAAASELFTENLWAIVVTAVGEIASVGLQRTGTKQAKLELYGRCHNRKPTSNVNQAAATAKLRALFSKSHNLHIFSFIDFSGVCEIPLLLFLLFVFSSFSFGSPHLAS